MKYIAALLFIVFGSLAAFAQAKTLAFADNSTLEVVHEQKTDDAATVKITVKNQSFNAVLSSTGKAVPPLRSATLKRLARTNKTVAAQIKKLNSAYEIAQGDVQYYFATYNSVNYDRFRSCSTAAPCRIKAEAVVITLDDNGKKENIVVLKSIQKLK